MFHHARLDWPQLALLLLLPALVVAATEQQGISSIDHVDEYNIKHTMPNLTVLHAYMPELRRYTVDLSAPAFDRWAHIVKAEQKVIDVAFPLARDFILDGPTAGKQVFQHLETNAANLVNQLSHDTAEELRGVAHYSNFSLADVLMFNMVYEFAPFGCAAIVAEDVRGWLWHARIVEWELGYMQQATILVDFVSGDDKVIFSGITWTGIVGFVTGQRHGAFAVHLNERAADHFAERVQSMLSAPLVELQIQTFLIRHILATVDDYETAVQQLETVPIYMPAYLTVSGTGRGEAAVITRLSNTTLHTRRLANESTGWYLVQTNDDYWRPPKDDRRQAAQVLLQDMGQARLDYDNLRAIYDTPPISRDYKVYLSVMCAGCPNASAALAAHTHVVYDGPYYNDMQSSEQKNPGFKYW